MSATPLAQTSQPGNVLTQDVVAHKAAQPEALKPFVGLIPLAEEHAKLLAGRMRELKKWMERLAFPLNVAAGMEARGIATGEPKMIVSDASARIKAEIVAGLRAQFAEWNLPPFAA